MVFLHDLLANSSIWGTSTAPLTLSSASASTTLSATTSAFSGFTPPAPNNPLNAPPVKLLKVDPAYVNAAIGTVKALELSYINGALKNTLLNPGNSSAITLSASLFVVMYLLGSTGAPAAAEMYPNAPTFALAASFANKIALSRFIISYVSCAGDCGGGAEASPWRSRWRGLGELCAEKAF